MLILHPYSSNRAKDKEKTWKFLNIIRAEHKVIDKLIDEPMDYHNFIAGNWGYKTFIIIEDDKVPTLNDLEELINCEKLVCVFPYPFSYYHKTTMKDWTIKFPYSLGVAKFDIAIQDRIPVESWYKKDAEPYGLDRQIEEPIINLIGQIHVHNHFIKHNHKPNWKQWGYSLLHGH